MLAFDALVRGRVTYEVAGPPVHIPQGRCRVQPHEGFVSLLWSENEWTHSATLTAARFEESLEAGAVVVLDAGPTGSSTGDAKRVAQRLESAGLHITDCL
jgi:hypothetical protein